MAKTNVIVVKVPQEMQQLLDTARVIIVESQKPQTLPMICTIAETHQIAMYALQEAVGIREDQIFLEHGAYETTMQNRKYANAIIHEVSDNSDGFVGGGIIAMYTVFMTKKQIQDIAGFLNEIWL